MVQLFGLIKAALADRLLIWAALGSIIVFGGWTIIRNPDPIRLLGVGGLFIPVLAMLLYYSSKRGGPRE
jgi:hypothetical protein